jgi:hypothetical protein
MTDLMQVIAELTNECFFATRKERKSKLVDLSVIAGMHTKVQPAIAPRNWTSFPAKRNQALPFGSRTLSSMGAPAMISKVISLAVKGIKPESQSLARRRAALDVSSGRSEH